MTDIGSTLREARMHARIDIIDVEQATKIRAKYLRAMEDEEWSVLPGPTFVKSFLRTYADYLGLDSRALVESYKRIHENVSEGDLQPFGAARRARNAPPAEPGRWRTALLVGGVLAVIVVALILIGQHSGNNGTPPPTTAAKSTHAKKRRRHHARATARAKTVRLQVVPTGSVYVCLLDGSGRKLIPGLTMSAGNPSRTFVARRFRITLGNAEAGLRVNGRLGPVPASANGVGLQVTAKGRSALSPGTRPNCG